MADRSQTDNSSLLLALLAPAEEPFAQAVGRAVRRHLTVVRTRQEFERRLGEHEMVLVGDHQSTQERVSTVRRASKSHGECMIVALADDLRMEVELLEAGAAAVAKMADGPEVLAQRISAAFEGGILLNPEEAAAVVSRLQALSTLCVDQGVDVERCGLLTTREREIAALLGNRLDNASIARELGIAVGTVKTHVHKILDKLDVDSRVLAGVYWRVYVQKRGERR
ncbi:MAG: response regulator transcription factor [Gemmatimonadota bacterium]